MNYQCCESAVLEKEEWSQLRYRHIKKKSVEIFQSGFDGENYHLFAEGQDYEIDYIEGKIRRTKNSSIADYTESIFYHVKNFNHTICQQPWGNYPYMLYISYLYDETENVTVEEEARRIFLETRTQMPQKTIDKLLQGQEITYVVFGDSISTGCEALYKKEAYFNLFWQRMNALSGVKCNIINSAIGGETTCQGAARFEKDVLSHKPDIISIAYGVNDMRITDGKPAVTLEEFRQNTVFMIEKSLSQRADVILITNLIPNPYWIFTNPEFGAYADVFRTLAAEYGLPLADVQKLWHSELKFGKKLPDLLLNDINHPTSYGHYLYFKMLENLL